MCYARRHRYGNHKHVYRDFFKSHVEGGQLKQIRTAVNKGLALGNERFKDEVEALYGRRVRPEKMGRPKV